MLEAQFSILQTFFIVDLTSFALGFYECSAKLTAYLS